MRILLLIFGISFLMLTCRPVFYNGGYLESDGLETTFLDTLVVSSAKRESLKKVKKYQESAPRNIDLLHTHLELSFDWNEEAVFGKAKLLIQPYYYSLSVFEIDAINFNFDSIGLTSKGSPINFIHTYDGRKLIINTKNDFDNQDSLLLILHYSAFPSSDPEHQSNQDDKGLYFIQEDSITKRRKEIWTLGETQWNAKWFPTINQPNEKTTQSIYLTIDSNLTSISNGTLVSSIIQDNGTKTDHWDFNLPHSTYLTSIVIGDFDVTVDSLGAIPLAYYVKPGFKEASTHIFGDVSDMIDFFSKTFKYPFPWPDYKQVVVQDFVSGAMENTSASIFGDFIQKNRFELYGLGNDPIVAHELAHQWFGNLVTCENWANITLNESFANYAELLWINHRYGKSYGDLHRLQNRQEYFQDVFFNGASPVVNYYFSDPENLFNKHTYNKGGAILHMIKKYLGDSCFFDGLSYYLNENKYFNTEIDHLRLALEKVSGIDLKKFFDQWFFYPGHPKISMKYEYNSNDSLLSIKLKQQNPFDSDPEKIFSFPISIGCFVNGELRVFDYYVTNRTKNISIPLEAVPQFVILDPQLDVLAEYDVNYTNQQWETIFNLSVNVGWKIRAMETLLVNSDYKNALISLGLKDSSIAIRKLAIEAIENQALHYYEDTLLKIGQLDRSPIIRAKAWEALRNISKTKYFEEVKNNIKQENSSIVLAELIKFWGYGDKKNHQYHLLDKFENRSESAIVEALGNVYSKLGDTSKIDFFYRHLYTINQGSVLSFYKNFLFLHPQGGLKIMYDIANDKRNNRLRKYGATSALFQLTKNVDAFKPKLRSEADSLLNLITSSEKDRMLLDIYFPFK